MKLKTKIAKWIGITQADLEENDYYGPKKFGEARSVEYSIDGLVNCFCKVSAWSNGEGYDIAVKTYKGKDQSISLHTDELDCVLHCLNDLKYFE